MAHSSSSRLRTIQAVVAMIPHRPKMQGRLPSERFKFFLVEKPGLDFAVISGVEEDVPGDAQDRCSVE
jgi:hypothetical protein